jgi:hypothetical protein
MGLLTKIEEFYNNYKRKKEKKEFDNFEKKQFSEKIIKGKLSQNEIEKLKAQIEKEQYETALDDNIKFGTPIPLKFKETYDKTKKNVMNRLGLKNGVGNTNKIPGNTVRNTNIIPGSTNIIPGNTVRNTNIIPGSTNIIPGSPNIIPGSSNKNARNQVPLYDNVEEHIKNEEKKYLQNIQEKRNKKNIADKVRKSDYGKFLIEIQSEHTSASYRAGRTILDRYLAFGTLIVKIISKLTEGIEKNVKTTRSSLDRFVNFFKPADIKMITNDSLKTNNLLVSLKLLKKTYENLTGLFKSFMINKEYENKEQYKNKMIKMTNSLDEVENKLIAITLMTKGSPIENDILYLEKEIPYIRKVIESTTNIINLTIVINSVESLYLLCHDLTSAFKFAKDSPNNTFHNGEYNYYKKTIKLGKNIVDSKSKRYIDDLSIKIYNLRKLSHYSNDGKFTLDLEMIKHKLREIAQIFVEIKIRIKPLISHFYNNTINNRNKLGSLNNWKRFTNKRQNSKFHGLYDWFKSAELIIYYLDDIILKIINKPDFNHTVNNWEPSNESMLYQNRYTGKNNIAQSIETNLNSFNKRFKSTFKNIT